MARDLAVSRASRHRRCRPAPSTESTASVRRLPRGARSIGCESVGVTHCRHAKGLEGPSGRDSRASLGRPRHVFDTCGDDRRNQWWAPAQAGRGRPAGAGQLRVLRRRVELRELQRLGSTSPRGARVCRCVRGRICHGCICGRTVANADRRQAAAASDGCPAESRRVWRDRDAARVHPGGRVATVTSLGEAVPPESSAGHGLPWIPRGRCHPDTD